MTGQVTQSLVEQRDRLREQVRVRRDERRAHIATQFHEKTHEISDKAGRSDYPDSYAEWVKVAAPLLPPWMRFYDQELILRSYSEPASRPPRREPERERFTVRIVATVEAERGRQGDYDRLLQPGDVLAALATGDAQVRIEGILSQPNGQPPRIVASPPRP